MTKTRTVPEMTMTKAVPLGTETEAPAMTVGTTTYRPNVAALQGEAAANEGAVDREVGAKDDDPPQIPDPDPENKEDETPDRDLGHQETEDETTDARAQEKPLTGAGTTAPMTGTSSVSSQENAALAQFQNDNL